MIFWGIAMVPDVFRVNNLLKQPLKHVFFVANNRKASVISGTFLLFVAFITFAGHCCSKEYTSMY